MGEELGIGNQELGVGTPGAGLERLLQRYPILLQLLRFVAIGVLNTALDFIILNLLTKALHIEAGLSLGSINVIGFSAAVIQSYFWNRYWAFGGGEIGALAKNFIRLVLVGGLGALGFLAVAYGVQTSAAPLFYFIVLIIFVAMQLALFFYMTRQVEHGDHAAKFLAFLIVSIMGLLINSVLLALLSSQLLASTSIPPDAVKNIAKVLATLASLIWNFIGYKVIVFRK